jgi:hypothetical protein
MKKKVFIGFGVLLFMLIGYEVYQFATTRSHSPIDKAEFSNNGLDMKVSYCRPFKKGRLIFGEEKDKALLPNGKYWRLGANDATEITFSKNISFAGTPVKAGSYRMYAVPNADSWEISLNSELGKFGFFEPDYKLDVAKVKVPVQTAPVESEQLTINFAGDTTSVQMNIVWDKTLVTVPIASVE